MTRKLKFEGLSRRKQQICWNRFCKWNYNTYRSKQKIRSSLKLLSFKKKVWICLTPRIPIGPSFVSLNHMCSMYACHSITLTFDTILGFSKKQLEKGQAYRHLAARHSRGRSREQFHPNVFMWTSSIRHGTIPLTYKQVSENAFNQHSTDDVFTIWLFILGDWFYFKGITRRDYPKPVSWLEADRTVCRMQSQFIQVIWWMSDQWSLITICVFVTSKRVTTTSKTPFGRWTRGSKHMC